MFMCIQMKFSPALKFAKKELQYYLPLLADRSASLYLFYPVRVKHMSHNFYHLLTAALSAAPGSHCYCNAKGILATCLPYWLFLSALG